jgi:hypothetical protein
MPICTAYSTIKMAVFYMGRELKMEIVPMVMIVAIETTAI